MSELERTLVSLSRELDVPEPPDLVPAVTSRLAPRRRHVPLRRLSLAVAFVLVALLAATLAIPSARSALFDVLHIGGEEIVRVDELPPVSPRRPLSSALGRRVSLAEARRAAGFRVRTLAAEPDRVYVGENGTVWFLYGTPAHVRLLVAQTPHERVDRGFFQKLITTGTKLETVEVDGAPGAFLSGAPHEVILVNEHGIPVFESARLARNVLVWSRDGIAYRLEGDFSRDEALRLARSLQP
jgi:uncharacterized protein DUF4367